MYKAGGIIGLIAGVFGFIAAVFTLLTGGLLSTLKADAAGSIVWLGWGGILFSFLTIVFAALIFNKPKGAGIGLMICAVLGGILGGSFVAVCMVLAAIGGLIAVLDKSTINLPLQVNSAATNNDFNQTMTRQTSRKPWVIPVLISLTVLLLVAIIAGLLNMKKSEQQVKNANNANIEQVSIAQDKTNVALDELAEKTPDNTDAEILVRCWKTMQMGTLAEKKKCSDETENGKVVQWFLDVDSVQHGNDGYIVNARAALGIPVTIYVQPRNQADKSFLENLNTADSIAFKGVMNTANSDNTIVVNPAILVSKPVKVSTQSVEEQKPTVQQDNASENTVSTPKTAGKGHSAFVYNPPSNVRDSPNGSVLCSIDKPTNITVYEYAGSTQDGNREVKWYYTDACGSMGVIAYSQFR